MRPFDTHYCADKHRRITQICLAKRQKLLRKIKCFRTSIILGKREKLLAKESIYSAIENEWYLPG